MSVDYSMLHNSVEAIAARVNFDVVVSSLKMIENYFDQVRDANTYGAEASRHSAEASQSMHNEMADQLHQQYIEHSVHAAANGGMACGYGYKEATSIGPSAQAQKEVNAAQMKLDALKGKADTSVGAESGNAGKDIEMKDMSKKSKAEKETDTAKAAKELENEIEELTRPGKNHCDYAKGHEFEIDPKTQQFQLKDDYRRAIEVIKDKPDLASKFEKAVRKDHREANKRLQRIESGKSQWYDKARSFQQLAQTTASAKTEYERALDQKMVGQYEAMKNLAEWTNQAFQLTSQLATTMSNTLREQGVSSIANLTNALIQSNRAA